MCQISCEVSRDLSSHDTYVHSKKHMHAVQFIYSVCDTEQYCFYFSGEIIILGMHMLWYHMVGLCYGRMCVEPLG